MKFASIKNDFVFGKVFCNQDKKIILISFLNAVMKLNGDDAIEEVEIINPYQLPIIQNLKASIIDVKAKDKKGRSFIIEMQVAEQAGLDKRLLYYASKEYSLQIESGERYTELKPVIFIGIFDFKFIASENYLSHHAVCDVETGERALMDMDFYFIELPKFTKPLKDLTEIIDKWVFFIKEAEHLSVIPEHVDDKGLEEAYRDANKHGWAKEELAAYDYAAMREQDERGRIELAERRAEERAEKRTNEIVAIKMKQKGMSVEEIADLTGLSVEEIAAL